MVRLLKNPQVTVVSKELPTKDGKCEVTIKLDLNINLEGTSITVDETKKEKDEKVVPDFQLQDFQLQKIKFGEKVMKG